MSLQAIYEKTRAHFLTQGKKALDENDFCVYRTNDGLKCAVGCHITDEAYSPDLEGVNLYVGRVKDALSASIPDLDADTLNFLRAAQSIHDGATNSPNGLIRAVPELDTLAISFDLKVVTQ